MMHDIFVITDGGWDMFSIYAFMEKSLPEYCKSCVIDVMHQIFFEDLNTGIALPSKDATRKRVISILTSYPMTSYPIP